MDAVPFFFLRFSQVIHKDCHLSRSEQFLPGVITGITKLGRQLLFVHPSPKLAACRPCRGVRKIEHGQFFHSKRSCHIKQMYRFLMR